MKRRIVEYLCLGVIALSVLVFFRPFFLSGKLPVPSDTLVGLYHPWRDLYAADYPRGVPFRNFLITDPVRQQIPWRRQVIESWKKGIRPSWDPTSYSGTPLAANIQSGAFNPFNILFFLLPFDLAWSVLIIIQPLLAGIFMYLFLRGKSLHPLASVLGAVVFAFSGFSIAWMAWGTVIAVWMWTPLGLLSVDRIMHAVPRKKFLFTWSAVLSVALVFQFFAGHSQVFLYSCLVLAAYVLGGMAMAEKNTVGKRISYLCLSLMVMFIVTALQWPDYLRFLSQTGRYVSGSVWTVPGFFIPGMHLLQFFVPDYFGNPATLNYWGVWNYGEFIGYAGAGSIVLALYALVAAKSRTVRFFALLAGVAVLFAMRNPVSELPYRLGIPVLSGLQPTRLMSVIDLSLAVLSAYGLHTWLASRNRLSMVWSALGTAVFAGIVWLTVFLLPRGIFGTVDAASIAVTKRNGVLPTLLMLGIAGILAFPPVLEYAVGKRMRRTFLYAIAVLVIGVTMFDLLRFGGKFTPFTERRFFFPETRVIKYLEAHAGINRIMPVDDRVFAPDTPTFYGLESVAGYDPLHWGRYDEFIAAMERGKADIAPPFGFDRVMQPKNYSSPLFPLLNVRYVISLDPVTDPRFVHVFSEGETKVYEYRKTIPRVFLARGAVFADSKQKAMDMLYAQSFDPQDVAVLEFPADVMKSPKSDREQVTMQEYGRNRIVLNVTADNPRPLVVLNPYVAGWQARMDGRPVPLYRADYLFMATIVPPGTHAIVLEYR